MLCYGAALILNDAWLEQVVKRGWTDREIPNALQPGVTAVWGVVLLATAVLFAVLARRSSGRTARPRATRRGSG
jgi:hypothetical protein